MVLQRRQNFTGPVLELRILAALGIALEQRDRILVGTDLHRIIFTSEILRLAIASLPSFFCEESSSAVGSAAFISPETMPFSSVLVLV